MEYSIGESKSWMLATDENGCAVAVPADDIFDAEGVTLPEAQQEANRLARAGVRYEGLDVQSK
jgi:hypothetical protein